ncbi:hypothetical protein THRCLA_07608 [Thraustotheca clavata]|uniref:Aminoglycoside phosphotransferase domain-containing protein n=1 Tax=Thraustotheca clavata TaxID=74557 RepID=A0A1V9ZCM8_9STRA|nr:hypothetical protein THRCLA_07608 [Thraustotheca clavata]
MFIANFELESTVRTYITQLDSLPESNLNDDVMSAVRLSGGFVNHVWRITFISKRTIILKQYPVTIKWDPNMKLPQQRSQVEYCALSSMQSLSNNSTLWSSPKPLFYDAEASVVIMSDVGSDMTTLYDLLRKDHGEPPVLNFIGDAVNEFVASVQDVAEPKAPQENMTAVLDSTHDGAKASLEKALGSEIGLKWFERSLKARAIQKEWIFGDLWPSGVLVHPEQQRIAVVDWECCRPAHSGMDVTQMCANLFLMTMGTPFHNLQAKECLQDIVRAAKQSRAYDPTFDYAGAFVGHVAVLVAYPHWELPAGPSAAIAQAANEAESIFC